MSNKKTDQAVLVLLKKVRKKKEAIATRSTKVSWLTSCTLSLDPNNKDLNVRKNFQTIRDETKLVEIAAFLIERDETMQAAAFVLNVTHDASYMGYTYKDWLEDLKTRVSMLTLEKEKKELDTLNKRIDALVTLEQRREMELLELTKLLED